MPQRVRAIDDPGVITRRDPDLMQPIAAYSMFVVNRSEDGAPSRSVRPPSRRTVRRRFGAAFSAIVRPLRSDASAA